MSDTTEQRLALALDVLRQLRRGAAHESCTHSGDYDNDPDPSFHCCDWGSVIDRIDAVLEGDTQEVGYFDIIIGLQQLVSEAFKEGCRETSPFADNVDERWEASKV